MRGDSVALRLIAVVAIPGKLKQRNPRERHYADRRDVDSSMR